MQTSLLFWRGSPPRLCRHRRSSSLLQLLLPSGPLPLRSLRCHRRFSDPSQIRQDRSEHRWKPGLPQALQDIFLFLLFLCLFRQPQASSAPLPSLLCSSWEPQSGHSSFLLQNPEFLKENILQKFTEKFLQTFLRLGLL